MLSISIVIDYETSSDKLKHVHTRERPRSRPQSPYQIPPHRQEYMVKTTSINVPLIDQQGHRNAHCETPLVSHHVETENRFVILARELSKDHSHVITEPITVPPENIDEVANIIVGENTGEVANISVLA